MMWETFLLNGLTAQHCPPAPCIVYSPSTSEVTLAVTSEKTSEKTSERTSAIWGASDLQNWPPSPPRLQRLLPEVRLRHQVRHRSPPCCWRWTDPLCRTARAISDCPCASTVSSSNPRRFPSRQWTIASLYTWVSPNVGCKQSHVGSLHNNCQIPRAVFLSKMCL